MEVPFLDLKKAYSSLKVELNQLWQDINNDANYVLGKRLELFEQEFADYLGVKHVIGVADGLDALVLSLRALGVRRGDEVIVPAHTYIASWLAISELGAIPIPVEIDENCLIDPSKIEPALSERTRVIMPVHLYGRVCRMELIQKIALQYNLKIVEDSAQAHGAFEESSGKKAGSFGDASGFSFYPGKNLGCFGDGGCISTNDDLVAQNLKLLRNYGSKVKYEHEVIGVNSRLDELQAGVLSIKLKHLDDWNAHRRNIAKIYLTELENIDNLSLPNYTDGHVWHVFQVRTSLRDQLKSFLTDHEVSVNVHYPTPIHLQPAYKYMNFVPGDFPITEKLSKEVLSLPIGPHLSIEEAMYSSMKIKEFFGNEKSCK